MLADLLHDGIQPLQRLLCVGPLLWLPDEAVLQQLVQTRCCQSLHWHLWVLPARQHQPADGVRQLASKGCLPRQHVHHAWWLPSPSHTSAGRPAAALGLCCYGAMYNTVPSVPCLPVVVLLVASRSSLLMPKSVSTGLPLSASSTLAGLTSSTAMRAA
jgi:hypothetical protein